MVDTAALKAFLTDNNVSYNYTKHVSWYAYMELHWMDPKAHIGAWSASVGSRLLGPENFASGEEQSAVVEAVGEMMDLGKGPPKKLNVVIMLVAPVAYQDQSILSSPSSLHPTWRPAILSIRAINRWDQFNEPNLTAEELRQFFQDVNAGVEWLRKLASDMGISLNEADVWEENAEKSFWGEDNYRNLMEIKMKVGPGNLLTNWGAVGTSIVTDSIVIPGGNMRCN